MQNTKLIINLKKIIKYLSRLRMKLVTRLNGQRLGRPRRSHRGAMGIDGVGGLRLMALDQTNTV